MLHDHIYLYDQKKNKHFIFRAFLIKLTIFRIAVKINTIATYFQEIDRHIFWIASILFDLAEQIVEIFYQR